MTFKKNLKSRWQKYCNVTTVHGFLELSNAPTWRFKIFWIIILLGGATMTVFELYLQVSSYNDSPIKTVIEMLQSNVVQAPPMLFPAFHYSQWLDSSKVKETGMNAETFLYAWSYFKLVITPLKVDLQSVDSNLKNVMKQNNFTNLYDIMKAVSMDRPNYLLNGKVMKMVHGTMMSWGPMNVTKFLEQGIFYYMVYPDTTYDTMSFIINPIPDGNDTAFHSWAKSNLNYSFLNEYAFDVLNYLGEYSWPFVKFNFGDNTTQVMIDPFSGSYEVHVKATFYSWSPWVQKNCFNTDPTFNAECWAQCANQFKNRFMAQSVFQACALQLTDWQFMEDVHYDDLRMAICANNSYLVNETNTSYTFEEYQKCQSDCQSTCRKWKFEISQLIVPMKEKSMCYVNIVYDTDDVLSVSQFPAVSWDDVLANIGGLLGLWLGGSFLSFIQLIYVCCCNPVEQIDDDSVKPFDNRGNDVVRLKEELAQLTVRMSKLESFIQQSSQ